MENKDNNKLIGKLIIYASFVIVLLITLFFSRPLENLLLLKPDIARVDNGSFETHFVDVGDGDAILVRFTNGKTLLVDSGPQKAEANLLNYIDNVFFANTKTKDKKFDYVVLTHSDIDHAGNMLKILDTYKIGTFIRPQIYVENLEMGVANQKNYFESNTEYAYIISKLNQLSKSGLIKVEFSSFDTYYFMGLDSGMHILSPVHNYYSTTNEFSPIMVVYDKEIKVMLTGDATTNNELEVINNYNRDNLDVDILKLGHHGSNTSTSMDLLDVTTPKYAVVSVDKNNDNHPSEEVLNNIIEYNQNSANDVLVKQTSSLGNIIFYSLNGNIEVDTIDDVNNYLFLSWWVIVISLIIVVGISMFLNNLIALIFKNKKSAIKY